MLKKNHKNEQNLYMTGSLSVAYLRETLTECFLVSSCDKYHAVGGADINRRRTKQGLYVPRAHKRNVPSTAAINPWMLSFGGSRPILHLYQNFHLANSSGSGNCALPVSIQQRPNAQGAWPQRSAISKHTFRRMELISSTALRVNKVYDRRHVTAAE